MDQPNNINDAEFIPFLHSLGVETFKKSFEWMLNDPEYADVLGWIYNNIDQNNALTAREECRYTELEKQGKILSPAALEVNLLNLQDEFKGLCLPGEQDALEDLKLNIQMQKEKLSMLNKQKVILEELIVKNEAANEELTMELTQLNANLQQASDDEKSAGEECIRLAKEVEAITNDVVDVIADALNTYGSCAVDKEFAKRFFTYGPFESYNETQELFKSHFDMYSSTKFGSKYDNTNSEDMRMALAEAKNMEERLSDAVCAYIESKADLSGEHAKLILISDCENTHRSLITVSTVHAQKSAIQLLEQDESILDQQIQNAVKYFVERRTNLVLENVTRSALSDREQMHKDITFLQDVTSEVAALGSLLYGALRRELHSVEEVLHFAAQLRAYLLQEDEFVSDRIKSINDTCNAMEQDLNGAETSLQTPNILLRSLFAIFDAEPKNDPLLPVKLYNDMRRNIRELKDNVHEEYKTKEAALVEVKNASTPLYKLIWDGSTNQPNCHNRGVSTLSHELTDKMAAVDAKVTMIRESFNTVKHGDTNNRRKLWQWFLADPSRFLAAMKNIGK